MNFNCNLTKLNVSIIRKKNQIDRSIRVLKYFFYIRSTYLLIHLDNLRMPRERWCCCTNVEIRHADSIRGKLFAQKLRFHKHSFIQRFHPDISWTPIVISMCRICNEAWAYLSLFFPSYCCCCTGPLPIFYFISLQKFYYTENDDILLRITAIQRHAKTDSQFIILKSKIMRNIDANLFSAQSKVKRLRKVMPNVRQWMQFNIRRQLTSPGGENPFFFECIQFFISVSI